MIQLCNWTAIKSFASNRTARCKNCFFESNTINKGIKRITLRTGLGSNTRTLYLCTSCAEFELERLRELSSRLERAIQGWYDSDAEWYANRDKLNQEAV
jgi:hypothetical protein